MNGNIFERIKSTDFPVGKCRLAYYFAKGRHDHQIRKGSGVPYYVHPRGVAYLVMSHGGSQNQICAAFLHDLLEDTDTSYIEIYEGFGEEVADLCAELRNNKHSIEKSDKETYMTDKLCNMSERALLIKLCDIYYNMFDAPAQKAQTRMMKNLESLLKQRNIPDNLKSIALDILNFG